MQNLFAKKYICSFAFTIFNSLQIAVPVLFLFNKIDFKKTLNF